MDAGRFTVCTLVWILVGFGCVCFSSAAFGGPFKCIWAVGRLQAAFAKVRALEVEVEALKAALAQQDGLQRQGQASELAGRLALVAPVLLRGIECQAATCATEHLEASRRNVASHCFQVPAAAIARMRQPSLNRVQRRSGRRSDLKLTRYRKQPASHLAAEAVPASWYTMVRTGRPRSVRLVRGDASHLAARSSRASSLPAVAATVHGPEPLRLLRGRVNLSGPQWFGKQAPTKNKGEKMTDQLSEQMRVHEQEPIGEQVPEQLPEQKRVQDEEIELRAGDTADHDKPDSVASLLKDDCKPGRSRKKAKPYLDDSVDAVLDQAIKLAAAEAEDRRVRAQQAHSLVVRLQDRKQVPCPSCLVTLPAADLSDNGDSIECFRCRRGAHELLALAACFPCGAALCARCLAQYDG